MLGNSHHTRLSQTKMKNYCLKVLIFLPLTYMVLGEKICIKSSPDQPCVAPCSKDVPCLTLCEYFMQEYAQNGTVTDPAPRNVTLELLSGTHSLWLDSVPDYTISDKASVEVRSDNATIICNNSATIYFQNISVVQISGIKFIDCRYFVFWANTLSIEDSIIVGHHLWSTVETSLVTIVWSSFINGFTLEIRSTL